MGALANRDFVKMNGLGNEIVIVDLRQRQPPQGPIAAAEARAAARQEPYDQLMALYPARGGDAIDARSASTTMTARKPAPAATACAASRRWSANETGRAAAEFRNAGRD